MSNYNERRYERRHNVRTEQFARAIRRLMEECAERIMRLQGIKSINANKPFHWEDYPSLNKEMEYEVTRMATQMVGLIEEMTEEEWINATKKNDAFIDSIMDTSKLPKEFLKTISDIHLDALSTFQSRKVQGMDLSQRIWKYTNQFKQNIEDAIDMALAEGKSAQTLSQDVRQFLKDPNRFYRRFRVKEGEDKDGRTIYGRKWKRMIKTSEGNVRWIDEAPKSYHTGRGIYKSSYKNAMRLARSEINMAYRESEWIRWDSLDFVVGYEVHRAEVGEEEECKCDICESLKGRYPKTFKFVGWHPQCKCYVTPILLSDAEFAKLGMDKLKEAIYGDEYKRKSHGSEDIKMPIQFMHFIKHMKYKLSHGEMTMKNTPYFIKDNFVGGDIFKGLKKNIKS